MVTAFIAAPTIGRANPRRQRGPAPARRPPPRPPPRSTSAQADSVAPEVSTSSTSSTRRPATAARVPRGQREGPGLVRRPRLAPAVLRRRRPPPRQQVGDEPPPGPPRQRPPELGRLVVAPPHQPRPMQRHRRDQLGVGEEPAARPPPSTRRAAAPCRAGRRASAPAPSAARRRHRPAPPPRGPRPADAGCSPRRRPPPSAPISGTPHLPQVGPAMKWVSRQQAGQSPCARSVGLGAGEAARRIDRVDQRRPQRLQHGHRPDPRLCTAARGDADDDPPALFDADLLALRRAARRAARPGGLPARGGRRRDRGKAHRG